LKFEIRYPDKPPDEVDLPGPVVVIGRDPSADLVVHDVKCSRRHAVVEDTADGLVVRDTASANGVFVNGKRIERVPLHNGDVLRIGEVNLTLLNDAPGTLAMSPREIAEIEREQRAPVAGPTVEAGPLHSLPPPRAAPPPRPRAVSSPSRPLPRPAARSGASPAPAAASAPALLTLASLWAVNAPLSILGALVLAWTQDWRDGALVAALAGGVVLGVLSAVMALGLWGRKPWARVLQIVLAVITLPTCFALASIAILAYMMGASGRAQFARDRSEPPAHEPEFAATILATVLLGVLLTGGLVMLLQRTAFRSPGPPEPERRAVERLDRVATAQRAYQAGTCPGAYGDLEALMRPAGAIPGYAADGHAFLTAEFGLAEAGGYRYQMTTAEPVADCPSRAFRRYAYTASPQRGVGRYLLVGPDGVVRAAEGRPARADDPPAR
jgi:hypothetical protein